MIIRTRPAALAIPSIAIALAAFGSSEATAAPMKGAPRSVRAWAACDGRKDDRQALSRALDAASAEGFALIIDCPLRVPIGTDGARTIFVPSNLEVWFRGDGSLIVDNTLVPAFAIVNEHHITVHNLRVSYVGDVPMNWKVIGLTSLPAPGALFNDHVLRPWISRSSGASLNPRAHYWAGPTALTAVFFIAGNTSQVDFDGVTMRAAKDAAPSQFMPLCFALKPAYKGSTANTEGDGSGDLDVPHEISFHHVVLDGYDMGWQGSAQKVLITDVEALRYSDLQKADGTEVGGVGKWFAPPHLFYFNDELQNITRLLNRDIQIERVADRGKRVGSVRDHRDEPRSGYANSLKIGAINSSVKHYLSARPDGFADILPSDHLSIMDVKATFDTSYTQNIYPALRFPGGAEGRPNYQNVVLSNIELYDLAEVTKVPIVTGNSDQRNSNVVFSNISILVKRIDDPAKSTLAVNFGAPGRDLQLLVRTRESSNP